MCQANIVKRRGWGQTVPSKKPQGRRRIRAAQPVRLSHAVVHRLPSPNSGRLDFMGRGLGLLPLPGTQKHPSHSHDLSQPIAAMSCGSWLRHLLAVPSVISSQPKLPPKQRRENHVLASQAGNTWCAPSLHHQRSADRARSPRAGGCSSPTRSGRHIGRLGLASGRNLQRHQHGQRKRRLDRGVRRADSAHRRRRRHLAAPGERDLCPPRECLRALCRPRLCCGRVRHDFVHHQWRRVLAGPDQWHHRNAERRGVRGHGSRLGCRRQWHHLAHLQRRRQLDHAKKNHVAGPVWAQLREQ